MSATTPPTGSEQDPAASVGRGPLFAALVGVALPVVQAAWMLWLYLRGSALKEAGRMNEGDSEGCVFFLVFLGSMAVGPLLAIGAVGLGTYALVRGRSRPLPLAAILMNAVIIAGWVVLMFSFFEK